MIALQTLLPALAGLLFLLYLGYALTFWLLPAALGALRWAALPWTGYAAFVVLAQFATQAGLDMGATAILALALATAANALYAWRHGARPPASLSSPAGRVVVGLTLGLLVLGVAPLWLYGYHTIIGENWDGEIYLALGAYLRAYAQPALAQAPANPLLHILLVPPYSVRTHGFSYFQAALSALTGQPSLITLAPALALLRALAVPASYFFYRAAWRWAPRPALVATAALALNPFLLWITYNTFGMQVPSLGLLPLAAAATILALRAARPDAPTPDQPEPSRSKGTGLVAYAALVTAGLAVTYHPALTAWAAVVGVAGLALLLHAGRGWPRVAGAGVAVLAGAVALSAVAQWLGLQGFLKQYAEQTAGLGLTSFTAPTDALGLSLSFRTLLAAGPGQALLARAAQAYDLLIVAGGLLALALGAIWLGTEARRRDWDALLRVATLAGGLLYLVLFFRPLSYVYGWFKAQSFVAFLLVGAVVGGALWLWPRLRGRWARAGGTMALLVPTAALVLTLALLLWQYHWPLRYSAEMAQASEIERYVRPGDSALISGSRLMPGRLFNGLLAYFLRDARLYGAFSTANSPWDQAPPAGIADWTVAPAGEPPELYGLHAADRRWGNSLLSLYRAPGDLLFQSGWERRGDYPTSARGEPLSLRVAPAQITNAPGAGSAGAPPGLRRVALGVAVFTTQTLGIAITPASGAPPISQAVSLRPGLQEVAFDAPAPAGVTLAPGAAPLALRWATLRAAAGPASPPVARAITGVLTLRVESAAQGATVETRLLRVDTRAPDRRADRAVIDIYRPGSGAEADHYGYWAFALTAGASTLRAPLAGGPPLAGPGAAPLPDLSRRGPAQSGRFSASLTFYRGAAALDTVTDLYYFDARPGADGRPVISGVTVRTFPLLFY